MATEATADSIPAAVAGRDAAAAAAAGAGVSDLGKEIKKEKQKPSPIDTQNSEGSSYGPKTPSLVTPREREKKLGHRRVDEEGIVTYKKKPTSELMAAIQLGIGQSVGGLSSKPERDVLLQDFAVVESVFFPREGSNLTPAHHHSDFRFKTYAPVAFRYFRELFGIQADDFMLSLCNEALCELSNPGASGSIFYISNDDEFIIKTVQHKEADFLQKLLPGYYMNLNQNPRTLLPKFYGLYCYQCGGKNIRFIVMNNLLPSSIRMHEKYDLKGSTYKRKASKRERLKDSPTLKDLDFMDNHPEGILLEKETYDALIKTLQRDCRVLESFKIMDYSFLVGIHNLDLAAKEKSSTGKIDGSAGMDTQASSTAQTVSQKRGTDKALARGKSMRTRLAQYSTAMEAIQATSEPNEMENEDVPLGGIPARTSKGDRILLYVGLIDILQSYRLKKKLEHTMKAIVIEGDTISVHRPGFYAQRFQTFYATRAFKKIQTPLKHSPSKKKSTAGRPRVPPVTQSDSTTVGSQQGWRHSERTQRTISFSDEGAVGGKPDIVPEKRFHSHTDVGNISSTSLNLENDGEKTTVNIVEIGSVSVNEEVSASKRSELLSNTTAIHTYQNESIATMTHHTSNMGHSPPLSLSESTPTHTEYTEGTPSYTTSSPSCSSDVLDSQTGQAAAGDSRTSPLSLSPEKMSPVKKTSSSTETSFASAVETQDTTEMCVVDQRIMQTVAGENQVDEVTHL